MHLSQKKSKTVALWAGLLLLLGSVTACEQPPIDEPVAVVESFEPTCADDGYLTTKLSGAIQIELDWDNAELRCESMPRPDSKGVRMRLSGLVGSERLAILIALPELNAGDVGDGFDSIVTITVEDSGRFFSTRTLGTCWIDIATNQPVVEHAAQHIVVGSLSCVSPLGEINGDAFVDVQELRFSGLAIWEKQ